MVHHVFSRESRLALTSTFMRNVVTWGILGVWSAIGWIWPSLLPWWGWCLLALAGFVGLAYLGRYWADRDNERNESNY